MEDCRHIDLRRGDAHAVVCRTGAALVRLVVGSVPIVDGAPGDCRRGQFRGSVLAPWPGRLADGRYEHAGRRYLVPANEPRTGCALHGLVTDRRWDVEQVDDGSIVLGHRLGGDPGYPFEVTLSAGYALLADGVAGSVTATNRGTRSAPIGLGVHPYLTAGAAVDETSLHVPAATVVALDERGLPVEPAPTEGSPRDFREPRLLGTTALDDVFTDLDRDADDWSAIRLGARDGDVVTMALGPTARWATIYTSDTLPPPSRRSAVAVEPQTCPPDAFNSRRDLHLLAAGDSLTLAWRIRLERASPPG
jgi:aldose 1-epimerase